MLDRQQGFLPGRSILRNLIESEQVMQLLTLTAPDAAAVALDFSAAFPSLSQEYAMRVLREWGIPAPQLRAFEALYSQ